MARVTRIARIGLTTADLSAACAFYERGLGFERRSTEVREGAAFAALTGIEGARAEAAVLTLGGREIELVAFTPPGAPYPEPRAANDPWFQHFAVVVGDMAAAYARLSAQAQASISRGGPQLLPPSTGSVTAYKFRDPDGHPLELSHIPGSAWLRDTAPGAVLLGIDHSAIAVADLQASVAFYTGLLGMTVAGTYLNQGPEQDRLDGLDGVALDIVALETRDPGPHIELLHYRAPAPPRARAPLRPDAVGATRLVMAVEDAPALTARMAEAGAPVVSSPGAHLDAGGVVLVRDPDGHLLQLMG